MISDGALGGAVLVGDSVGYSVGESVGTGHPTRHFGVGASMASSQVQYPTLDTAPDLGIIILKL